jgi:glycosyltransferase involved in cell wall biosynthesis
VSVALVWTQFSAYHIDRIEAVAERLSGDVEVLACEIATASATYAWDPSGPARGARKVTLFPGQSYEQISWPRRFLALARALAASRTIFIGVSYAEPDIIALSWWLRLTGKRVIMMTESKFDDRPRRLEVELVKPLIFAPYQGAMVGGPRQADYVRFLGFRRRPVVEGYDCVGLARVQGMGEHPPAPDGPSFASRPFVFVGRLVAKKNVLTLVDAFIRYVQLAGVEARRLVIVGGGPLEADVRMRLKGSVGEPFVDMPGFLQAEGVARTLSGALALILPSVEEQWGLVVNEALAFNLPVIASSNVGSRDRLVHNLVNGYVVEPDDVEGLAQALLALASDEKQWARMARASADLAPAGDTPRFAGAVVELASSPNRRRASNRRAP